MSEHLKNWEQEIRADERGRIVNEIAMELETVQSALQRLSLWLTPGDPSAQEDRPRRKPTEATADQVQAVTDRFRDATSPLTPKHLTQVISGLGLRTAAAACRTLLEHGKIEAAGKKGFQAVRPNHQEEQL